MLKPSFFHTFAFHLLCISGVCLFVCLFFRVFAVLTELLFWFFFLTSTSFSIYFSAAAPSAAGAMYSSKTGETDAPSTKQREKRRKKNRKQNRRGEREEGRGGKEGKMRRKPSVILFFFSFCYFSKGNSRDWRKKEGKNREENKEKLNRCRRRTGEWNAVWLFSDKKKSILSFLSLSLSLSRTHAERGKRSRRAAGLARTRNRKGGNKEISHTPRRSTVSIVRRHLEHWWVVVCGGDGRGKNKK